MRGSFVTSMCRPTCFEPMIHLVSTVFARLAELTASGRRHAVATVVRTHGSTPQVIGARLVVTDDETERPVGTLGGGCVEADAILASREILKRGGRSLNSHSLNEDLAWNTGLVCGGTMWVLAEPGEEALSAGDRNFVEACARAAEGGPPLAIATLLERHGQGLTFVARMVVDAEGTMQRIARRRSTRCVRRRRGPEATAARHAQARQRRGAARIADRARDRPAEARGCRRRARGASHRAAGAIARFRGDHSRGPA